MTDFINELRYVFEKNELTRGLLNEEAGATLWKLYSHMVKVNEELNVTSITDREGVILKHLLDSGAVVPYIPKGARLCDVGCGGGFPSLVIATLREDVSILALDSVTKKVSYVLETAKMLSLENVQGTNRRAEELGSSDGRESFDCVTARAVGRLNMLCELCLPLLKVGGCFLAMKATDVEDELSEAQSANNLLGGKVESVNKYTLSNGREEIERAIIVIRKTEKTPEKYPRNSAQIKKKPIK